MCVSQWHHLSLLDFWPRVREHRFYDVRSGGFFQEMLALSVCVINFRVVMHAGAASVVYRAPLFSNRICLAVKMRECRMVWEQVKQDRIYTREIRTGEARGFGFPVPEAIEIHGTRAFLDWISAENKAERENNILRFPGKSVSLRKSA